MCCTCKLKWFKLVESVMQIRGSESFIDFCSDFLNQLDVLQLLIVGHLSNCESYELMYLSGCEACSKATFPDCLNERRVAC